MRTKLLVVAVAMALTAGCSSAPTNPYAAETARVAATTAVAPASASMHIAPAVAIQQPPEWYMKPTATTASEIYVSGTGLSKDLGMSGDKAVLHAQSRLVDRIAAEMSKLTKQYTQDNSERVNQNTEITIRKIAADVNIAGYTVVNSTLWSEGGGYRTYVLVKFPLTGISKQFGAKVQTSQANAERELKEAVVESRQRSSETMPTQSKPNSPLGLNDSKEED